MLYVYFLTTDSFSHLHYFSMEKWNKRFAKSHSTKSCLIYSNFPWWWTVSYLAGSKEEVEMTETILQNLFQELRDVYKERKSRNLRGWWEWFRWIRIQMSCDKSKRKYPNLPFKTSKECIDWYKKELQRALQDKGISFQFLEGEV